MSLVGTRPPTVDEWDKYELHHRARLATKPGLTGMWQVSGRSNITDFEEVVKLDKQYRGLGIETNPSSNYVIGTFKNYAKHPIFNFYNKGLTYDPAKLDDCAQLSVSVNTDDQGVFATSLENEYWWFMI